MKKILYILIAMLVVQGCSNTANFDVDVSGVDADVKVTRFDMDFDTISTTGIYSALPKLSQKYGDFVNLYMRGILGMPEVETADFATQYSDFVSYCKLNNIFRDVEKAFPKDEKIDALFKDGARHYKYYFPKDSLPEVFTVVSGFQESVFPSDGMMAFSLEKYLGADYPAYSQLGIEQYKRRRMEKAMMPVDYFRTLAMINYPKPDASADNLLNEMIYQGRIQYFLKSMMPSAPDSLLWGYSGIQYQWADAYEENVWNYLIDKKILFEINPLLIRNFTGEGPFTNAFGNQSAPGVASFCGFKIVCSFMANNPGVTLPQLMQMEDLQDIYNRARYNP
ncbi:MAG: hypothetical protein K6F33_13420 [Bacteroidales bacterium]|nr:hypothetical protein [Bacteroidales bacterium]